MNTFAVVRLLTLSTASFVIAILWTPALTHFLYKHKLGKRIRDAESAPIFSRLHAKKEGTPTMGGLLVWVTTAGVALAVAVLAWVFDGALADWNFLSRSQTLLPLGALAASAIVGLVDDYWNVQRKGPRGGGLQMRHRLAIYAAIAAVGAWWFTVKLERSAVHLPFAGSLELGWVYPLFFLFVIVATAFSVNETDGLDGLAGGTLLAAFASYAAIAFAEGRYDMATFCGVIAGALLAFLWFNINPARFFMGDTGAMSLGVTLGIVAMLTDTPFLLPVIGSVFVIESASVLVQLASKKLRGRKIFQSTPIHHHFEAIGWPEPKIVMRAWVIAAVSSAIGLVLFLVDTTK